MTTSSSFELISHPDRTLAAHLGSCDEISARILNEKYISANFYPKQEIDTFRKYLVYFHDIGKGTDFFQKRIIDAIEEEINESKEVQCFQQKMKEYILDFQLNKKANASKLLDQDSHLGTHARLGAHLVLLFFQHKDAIVEFIISKVIRRHHGELTNFAYSKESKPQLEIKENDFSLKTQLEHLNVDLYNLILARLGHKVENKVWNKLLNKFDCLEIDEAEEKLKKAKSYQYFFLQHYLFSLLLSADKGDMMLDKDTDKSLYLKPTALFSEVIIPNYKAAFFKGKEIKQIDIQRENAFQAIVKNCYDFGKENFFSITLPTGMGKTFCAFQAAIILQNIYKAQYNTAPKIIYCLPFTSIIDQNADILTQIVEQQASDKISRITKHHYLSSYNDKYDETELRNDEGEYLTVGWEHDFIVTTFVQLLETIFTNKNRTLRKFHNMTNAIIILDEVQNIPPKYFKVVEKVFKKMAEYFGTKFLFVTATQPFLFSNPAEVKELSGKAEIYFSALERIELNQTILKQHNYQPIEFEVFTEILCEDIRTNVNKSFLIICNTISYSQELFHFVKANFKDAEILYLSSSILPIKRTKIITNIKTACTQKAEKQLIVISTQVVEAGVDIDLDIVYRDLAPLDSINQSAGRCNRNGINSQKGVVKLFNSGKGKSIYDSTLLDITISILKERPISIPECDLFQINQQYAQKVRQKVAEMSDKADILDKAIKELALETVHKEFKLIEDNYPKYDVFIPFNEEAKQLWESYIATFKIKDDFERKRAIKKIKPALLQYVTRFPKNQYVPSPKDKDKSIIYEPFWEQCYSLEFGFIAKKDQEITLIF